MLTVPTSEAILSKAREFLGVPFLHQGRSRETGVDCVGLLVQTGRELGLDVYDNRRYASAGVMRRLIETEVAKTFAKLPPNARLRPGDILLQLPSHAAILTQTDPLTIIEAHDQHGVCEHTIDRDWMGRVYAVYRFPEVED